MALTKRAVTWAAIAALGLWLLASWTAPAKASHADVEGIGTVYGRCCTGNITRPGNGGALQSEPFRWDTTMVVATTIYPRGTPICVRWVDELACRDERGVQLMAGDYCPECNAAHIDLSFAIIRDRFGFCGDWDYWTCVAQWGRQSVTWWIEPPTTGG